MRIISGARWRCHATQQRSVPLQEIDERDPVSTNVPAILPEEFAGTPAPWPEPGR